MHVSQILKTVFCPSSLIKFLSMIPDNYGPNVNNLSSFLSVVLTFPNQPLFSTHNHLARLWALQEAWVYSELFTYCHLPDQRLQMSFPFSFCFFFTLVEKPFLGESDLNEDSEEFLSHCHNAQCTAAFIVRMQQGQSATQKWHGWKSLRFMPKFFKQAMIRNSLVS